MALTKKQKAILTTSALAAQVVVAPVILRDLQSRSDDELRGPRLLWRLWGSTNLLGAAAYWFVGRKPAKA
ncbi:hypothetical protein [Nocardioides panzhihuensis]|uniref:Cardiolipin synthase N-terminal domain-containing protein n=1 Tax=Nocardioides panzhihuensis TaxID=860243 RepID=A0A7Z0DLK9_9ACTN|nr:hypothetical protein [Nocardioides panzhihuensis]NYI77544.1 hypothetical protein [Nocardioides panzhihuensis]